MLLHIIGVDTSILTLVVDDKLVKLQIWDTAGQERYGYYKSRRLR